MHTFVGAGQPYLDDQLLHTILLDPTLAEPWRRSQWEEVKRVVDAVPNVESCVPRQDRLGEITITVSTELSDKEHQAALDGVVAALESIGLHRGEVNMRGLRLN